MKRLPLVLLCMGTVLSLGACGGGGGGGGGGSGGNSLTDNAAPNAAFTHRQWAGNATMKAAPNALSTAAQTNSALLPRYHQTLMDGEKISTSLYSLKAEPDGSVTLKNNAIVVANFDAGNMNFYTKNGVNFSVMSKTSTETVSGFQGSVTRTASLWLGKMDYASFGYWAQINEGKPDGTTTTVKAYHAGGFFYSGAGTISYFSPFAPLRFSGIAVGVLTVMNTSASEHYNMPMVGTATLTIVASGGSSTGLVLNFPGFYRLDANLAPTSTGTFSGKFTSITKLGDSSVPDLPTTMSTYTVNNYYSGHMYGPVFHNPTEAVGIWSLAQSSGGKITVIEGAFGGKKN